ncbi:basic amino acid/polyamine antiporter [Demequina mangrovi]|uniref:Arginine:ornithine antiporter, APA family n=1 Tax=Demequina mangrovi TaxID=1043493 RepID=A0A1H6UT40_9MICO|nr:basic amino acid/polyamine antiporter [Demequina mangrovi]SEI91225.1 arginine:ornithine antiporter, APA family [Demequina mangrovi]
MAGSPERAPVKLSLLTMTTMVVGTMVGAGVFTLPQRFAAATGVSGALIAWTIAGAGTLTLALMFQALSNRKPHLDAGIYAYAKAGFGEYLGFFSAFGYWATTCVGNVAFWVLIMSTLGGLFPALGEGDTILAVALSTAGLWGFYLLVRQGVREAAAINRIVTFAKLVPILVFIVIALFYVDPQVFADNMSGQGGEPLFDQVKATMLVMVFVFLGVEGASVYSRHAKRREDVGRATVLGYLSVFAIFASVTMVSYGIMPVAEMAELRQPSMAGVLEAAVGGWGSVFVSVGLIVSILGAYLAWTMIAAELLFVAAKDGDMPRFLARQSSRDVPVAALLTTSWLTQGVLLVVLVSADAVNFMVDLTSALSLIPFLFAAGYLLKIAALRDGYDEARSRRRELALGILTTAYVAFLLFAAGLTFVLVSAIIYAPASILFIMVRREQGRRWFSPRESIILAVSLAAAAVGAVGLATGWLSI